MAKRNYCMVIYIVLTTIIISDLSTGIDPEPHPSSSSAPPTLPPTTPKPSTPPTTPSTTSAAPPTTSTSTPSTTPNTTPTPTTTPIPPPTKPTTTSTAKPTSPTTTQPAPTTPKPGPKPGPSTGTWHVNYNSTNTSCILLQMAAIIELPYINKDNKTAEGQLFLSGDADADGVCGNETQIIRLKWSGVKSGVEKNDSLIFVFKRSNGTKFDLENVTVSIVLDNENFPNAKVPELKKTLLYGKEGFVTPISNSYKCSKTQTLNLTQINATVTEGSIKISNVQFQAFYNTTETKKFAEAVDCEPYETPDIVPIAVGCALAALIVIVLVTYLIGRRRNQARGYLSM